MPLLSRYKVNSADTIEDLVSVMMVHDHLRGDGAGVCAECWPLVTVVDNHPEPLVVEEPWESQH